VVTVALIIPAMSFFDPFDSLVRMFLHSSTFFNL